jgi:hypothetical protein
VKEVAVKAVAVRRAVEAPVANVEREDRVVTPGEASNVVKAEMGLDREGREDLEDLEDREDRGGPAVSMAV